ncbi:MAG: CCA tRNA nucleotidyltransferase, partial [Blastocatellia bacterium]
MLVGGSVRDLLLGYEPKDFDIEAYGLDPSILRTLLEEFGQVNAVGEKFTVYKLAFVEQAPSTATLPADTEGSAQRFEIDVSIPRRESKSGKGHRGFSVTGDPFMTFEDAARRRDFTVNAILLDPLTGERVDPFGGISDLEHRVLRVVAPETFVEDSLRVLRAVQFAARFEMTIDPGTIELCRSIDLSDLPAERIWGEIEKLLLMSRKPSIGLRAALDIGVLDKLFPELKALSGCPLDPVTHPEGDVFTHTALCLDKAAESISELPKGKAVTVMMAVLLHDAGKPLVTHQINGKVVAPGHDKAGLEPARDVLSRLGLHSVSGYDVNSQVLALVREHSRPSEFYRDREGLPDSAFRRLARTVDLDLLYRVSLADAMGRGPASSSLAQEWFIRKARELGVDHGPPAPLLLGRHLLEAGFPTGPA